MNNKAPFIFFFLMYEHEAVRKLFHLCMWKFWFAEANYKIILIHFPFSSTFFIDEIIFLNNYEITHLVIQNIKLFLFLSKNLNYNHWLQLLPMLESRVSERRFLSCFIRGPKQERISAKPNLTLILSTPLRK